MLILWGKQKYFEFAKFCKIFDFSDGPPLKKKETKFIKKRNFKKKEIKKKRNEKP